ncbi:ABC transporter permease [Nocardia brasiliensis]|uniref:ABC transporter permease n=1 Tax=Nocardia brasiliensis TaxID=37326 RepID=UPI00189636DE|nr:FtsX-like permease family protein [Nocardia brasiliensis]MBF6543158.1 FtsX-like permease family protein [Nocardia brasiliensis]
MTRHPTLRRKLLRDMRAQWPQFAAQTMIIVLGVALFTASYGAYRNLNASYDGTFETERFADVWVSGGDTAALAAGANAVPGVADAVVRTQVDLPLRVGADKLRGRVIGLPADRPPAVNAPTLLSGHYPGANEVLVDHHMADHFGLRSGATLSVLGPGGWREVAVAGVASSAEYLWPARSRRDMFPLPDNFGVLFAAEPLATALAAGAADQVVIRLAESPGSDAVTRIRELAAAHGATEVLTRAEQPSNWLLRMDIDAFGQLAYLFPLLFLSVAGLVSYVLLHRRVRAERPVIGVLLAGGVSRTTLLWHYLQYGIVAGLAGALGGILVGLAGSGALSRIYLRAIDLPASAAVVEVAPITLIGALLFGVAAGALGALAPALLAFRTPPAAAMRGTPPRGPGRIGVLERVIPVLRRLPARWLLVLRAIGRSPRRTWSTVLGTALSLVVMLTSWTMLDTMTEALDVSFHQVQTADARVDFTVAADQRRLAELTGDAGVAAAEPMVQLPITLATDRAAYPTVLIALPRDTTMHGLRPTPGSSAVRPDRGLLVGKGVRQLLGVSAGDLVEVEVPGAQAVRVPIAGVLDEPIGTFAYCTLEQLDALAGAPVPINSALLRLTPDADPDQVRRTLSERPGVAAYEDLDEMNRLIDRYAGFFFVFIGVMLALGASMAFAIIFTTMSINIVERRREVGVLRAGGMPHGMLARLITGENLLLTLLGIGPGLVLGVLGGHSFLSTYANDQFQLDLVVRPGTLGGAALVVLCVATVSLLPGLRAVRGLDLAAVLRERSD